MNATSLFVAAALAALALPTAAADTTCVSNALCIDEQSGTWGEGSCDDASPYYTRYLNHRVHSPEVPYAYAYTYTGCSGYDGDAGSGKFSWVYGNVVVTDPFGQLLFYGNVGWSTYELNGGGACYVSYFTYGALIGASGYGRNCSVGPVHPHPPVGLLP